jgi:hypothetical protein
MTNVSGPRHGMRVFLFVSLILVLAACSREPATLPALPADVPPAAPPADAEQATPVEDAPGQDPLEEGLSAAAGLPQALDHPLAEGVALEFDYGTLYDLRSGAEGERLIAIEPIDLAVEDALSRVAEGLRRAGYVEVAETRADARPGQRRFERRAGEARTVLGVWIEVYPDPEVAAHPGGTGTLGLHRVHEVAGE